MCYFPEVIDIFERKQKEVGKLKSVELPKEPEKAPKKKMKKLAPPPEPEKPKPKIKKLAPAPAPAPEPVPAPEPAPKPDAGTAFFVMSPTECLCCCSAC